MQIWNTIRTRQLAQEMSQLRNAFDEMKSRIGFDSIDDLEDFESLVSFDIASLICMWYHLVSWELALKEATGIRNFVIFVLRRVLR